MLKGLNESGHTAITIRVFQTVYRKRHGIKILVILF